MFDCSNRTLILSNITTPEAIENKVAKEIKVPAKTCALRVVPFPGTTITLAAVPSNKKTIPGVANLRAAVVEKYETIRTAVIGLMHHHGKEPGPPGFAIIARFGPPPGALNPISRNIRLGCRSNPKEPGAASMNGITNKVRRR